MAYYSCFARGRYRYIIIATWNVSQKGRRALLHAASLEGFCTTPLEGLYSFLRCASPHMLVWIRMPQAFCVICTQDSAGVTCMSWDVSKVTKANGSCTKIMAIAMIIALKTSHHIPHFILIQLSKTNLSSLWSTWSPLHSQKQWEWPIYQFMMSQL